MLRLNPKMAGRAELEKLLRRAVLVWPEFEDLTRTHLGMMGSKTLAHLERRGLIGEGKKRPKQKPPKNLAELRAKCIQEYRAFSAALGRPATSGDLFKRGESPLYFRIHRAFGGFTDFREFLESNDEKR